MIEKKNQKNEKKKMKTIQIIHNNRVIKSHKHHIIYFKYKSNISLHIILRTININFKKKY